MTEETGERDSLAPSEYSSTGGSLYSTHGSTSSRYGLGSTICGRAVFEPRDRFTLYKVEVNNGERTWVVYRRYSDFALLNKKLKRLFPGFQLNLPPKRFFKDNFNRNFIQKRQNGLQEFLRHLFSLQEIMAAKPVQEFFKLNNPPGVDEDLISCKKYCSSLELSINSLKTDLTDQDYELGRLRSELAQTQFHDGNPRAYNAQLDFSFTEKVLQQKLLAAQERAARSTEEVERLKREIVAERALELSTRQTERQQRELQLRDLKKEFQAQQHLEDNALKHMVSAFGELGRVKINAHGRSIDFETVEGVTEREQEVKKALKEAREGLGLLYKEHLEIYKKEIEDAKTDLIKTEYQLQTANTEIRNMKNTLEAVHASRDEEIFKRDGIMKEFQKQIEDTNLYAKNTEQKYFYSLILGVKLNMALWGKANGAINQMKPAILFSRVRDQGISIEHWPSWVSRELATLAEVL